MTAKARRSALAALVATASIAVAAYAQPHPRNVDLAVTGGAGSSLALELVQIPYYVGEDLILRVTVRNTHRTPKLLPLPTGLFVNEFVNPVPTDLSARGHVCFSPAIEDETAPARCLARMTARSVLFAPGQSRSALWASTPLRQLPLDAQRPLRYGVLFSSHGIVGEAHLRVTLNRIDTVAQGQLLISPSTGHARYFFTAPAFGDRHLLLAMGGWYRQELPPENFDAATLNAIALSGLTRYAIVSRPDVKLELDKKGHVLVDGKRVRPPPSAGVQSGWITADGRVPSTPDKEGEDPRQDEPVDRDKRHRDDIGRNDEEDRDNNDGKRSKPGQ